LEGETRKMVLKEALCLSIGAIAGGVAGATVTAIRVKEEEKRVLLERIKPKPATYPKRLRTAIVIATPDLELPRFRRCYRHLINYTRGQYQIMVVNTRFEEKVFDHSRDMNLVMGSEVDYYVLMNDDIYVFDGWLDALIHTALKDPKIGVVGGLWFYPDGKTIQHAGGYWNPALAKIGIRLSVGHLGYHKKLSEYPEALESRYCIFVTGALMLVTKECMSALKGWDRNLKTNWNDVDFCFRAWEEGFRVAYTPECRGIHEEGSTLLVMKRAEAAAKHATPHVKKKWSFERIMKIQKMVEEANKSGRLSED